MRRTFTLAVIALLMTLGLAPAQAGDFYKYNPQTFKDLQDQGKNILVEIDAGWCPVCAKQRPIIMKLSTTDDFKDMNILVVDFDKQKDAVRGFNANEQSTLIVYHGGKETGRSVGDTNPDAIRTLLQSAKG